jgi:probable F420-dependent oxidoreductase
MRISAKVPNTGELPAERGIAAMAAELERAGFDGLWSSDHVVMPAEITSRYPFADDGRATWRTDVPWYDAVVALSMMAAGTRRCELNVAVLVLPLRHPVEFAKQVASVDALAGGRVGVGVGAGWLREEFEALGVPFDSRGSRLDEWIGLLRACWTGRPPAHDGRHYRLPGGVLCYPTPAGEPPILIGGVSPAALRRAGRLGQGWVAHQAADRLDPGELRAGVAAMRRAAAEAGRAGEPLRVVLRVVGAAGRAGMVAARLPELAGAGVDEVVVDTDWDEPDDAARTHDLLRDAADAPGPTG